MKARLPHVCSLLAFFACWLLSGLPTKAEVAPLNVLFVFFDDMNDWTEVLSDPGIATPHLNRLAEQSAVFEYAYCAAPICNPSRVAAMTGVRPTNSGIYHNRQIPVIADHWIANVRTLPLHFQDQGYIAGGFGKIYHHLHQEYYEDQWTPGRVVSWNAEAEAILPEVAEKKYELPVFPRHFGYLPDDWDRDDPGKMQQDTANTRRTIEFLSEDHAKPFFLALGIYRPHSRFYSAKRYWNRFPAETIQLAAGIMEGDLEDVPAYGRMLALSQRFNMVPAYQGETHSDFSDLENLPDSIVPGVGDGGMAQPYLVENNLYVEAVRAYLAATAYADDMLGQVLNALEVSEYADNTIVVIASDHGYHLGEKQHWHKFALWERATRIPFIIRIPGQTDEGIRVASPVSLLDLYPTLLTLCGLEKPGHPLDGYDLSPLIRGLASNRGAPVVTTYYPGYHAVRDEQFRYIRYPDGSGELYDMIADPWEWSNLAAHEDYEGIIKALSFYIPQHEEPYPRGSGME